MAHLSRILTTVSTICGSVIGIETVFELEPTCCRVLFTGCALAKHGSLIDTPFLWLFGALLMAKARERASRLALSVTDVSRLGPPAWEMWLVNRQLSLENVAHQSIEHRLIADVEKSKTALNSTEVARAHRSRVGQTLV